MLYTILTFFQQLQKIGDCCLQEIGKVLWADDGLQRVGLRCTAKYFPTQLFFRCTFLCGWWCLLETLLLHNICNAVLHDGQDRQYYYSKLQSWVVISLEPRLPSKEHCTIFTRPPLSSWRVWVWDYSGDKLLLWCLVHQYWLLFYAFIEPCSWTLFWVAFTITLNRNEAYSYICKCLHSKEQWVYYFLMFCHAYQWK